MGLETAAIIMGAVATGATIGKMGFEAKAAAERNEALDLTAKQNELTYSQKSLSNLDTMQKVLDKQVAELSMRGVAFSSPSFNAIERNTLNVGSKEQRNLEAEQKISEANIKLEKENVRNTLFAQLFGDTANLAFTAASIYAKAPSKLPSMEE